MSVPTVGVIFYSTYGHIATMAEAVIEGVKATGVNVKVFQFAETLPKEVLEKMYAGSSLNPKYPLIRPDDLKELDGIIFGFPTRYGGAPAQVRAFFDHTGGLWQSGALVGKPVTMFTSTAGQHGGQETTHLATIPFFAHQGMVYVPIGYANADISLLQEVNGGSPWGASTIAAGDGSRLPTQIELGVARYQGKYFSEFVATLHKGKNFFAQQKNTVGTSGAAAKELPSALGPAAGVQPSTTEKEGYSLPPSMSQKETDAGIPSNNNASVQAQNTAAQDTAAQATSSAPAGTAAAKPKKKSGGFFASCCGKGNAIE